MPLSVKVAHLSLKQGELERYQQRQPVSEVHATNSNKEQTPRREEAVRKIMNDILNKAIVLVLNRNWQAVNVRTPQEAFCMMATNVATGLEIEGEDHIRPVAWEEWITLPIRDTFIRCL